MPISLEIDITPDLVDIDLLMVALINATNVSIDWGDGTQTTGIYVTGTQNHTYTTAAVYTVTISADVQGTSLGSFTVNANDSDICLQVLSCNIINVNGLNSFDSTFDACGNLTTVNISNNVLTNVTNMNRMFSYASNFNSDISGWDVSNVTNMYEMFAIALAFNSDISGWNVSSVTNMFGMFGNAAAFNQPIGNWNVSNVTTMELMFTGAVSFNADIGSWDVSSVTNMFGMFESATSFNQNLGGWDVSNVTNMTSMFAYSGLTTTNYDNLLIGWSALQVQPNVTLDMGTISYLNNQQVVSARNTLANSWTINDAGPINGIIFNINITQQQIGQPLAIVYLLAPSNVTIKWGDGSQNTGISQTGTQTHTYNSAQIFEVLIEMVQNSSLQSFSLSPTYTDINSYVLNCSTSSINNFSSFNGTFSDCSNLTTVNIDNSVFLNVSNMANMFNNASSFNSDISGWDVSSVTDMEGMFFYASSFNSDISAWDVSSVTTMYGMFNSASAFNSDISGWNVSSVTTMNSMFSLATSFNQNVGNWNVSNVNDMTDMFFGSGLSTNNYDNLLLGWSALQVQPAVTLDMGTVEYSNTTPVISARDILTVNNNWTINDGGVTCFVYGTKITCINDLGEEYFVNIEDLNDSHLIKTYLHGNRKMKHFINGTVRNGSNKELNCVYQINNLLLLGGHSILVDYNELTEAEINKNSMYFGNEMQKVDDKTCLLACASDKFEKIQNTEIYKWANICLENDGNIKNRYGIYANGILCETPTEEHIFSFKGINK